MPRMQDVDPEKWARIQEKFGKKDKAKPLRDDDGKSQFLKPEHNYGHGSQSKWEWSVFENADHFTVVRKEGARSGSHYARKDYKDFERALTDARSDKQSLIYAVTASGRSTVIDSRDWDRCLESWQQRKPT
jgi:hypothetical protein